MKSRIEKYYKEEELMQRTTKNDFLYDELYKEQMPSSNVTVLDNINEIDITKIKAMVDKRENYQKVRDVFLDKEEKNDDIEYSYEEVDDSNYDINEILKKKKDNYNNDESKIRKITNKEYEILSSLEVTEENTNILSQEKQLKDLFNTVTNTRVDDNDLFANLKEDEKEDESFYTNTSKFEEVDFKEEKENNNSKIFIVIAVSALLIAILIVIYLKFIK